EPEVLPAVDLRQRASLVGFCLLGGGPVECTGLHDAHVVEERFAGQFCTAGLVPWPYPWRADGRGGCLTVHPSHVGTG
ncbi:MAG: hypothetical protein ACRD0D_05085, partial [Acidimicrobiales bacterium]